MSLAQVVPLAPRYPLLISGYALQLTVSVYVNFLPLALTWQDSLSLQRCPLCVIHSFIMRCLVGGGNWMMLSFVHFTNVSLNQYLLSSSDGNL